MQSFLMPTVEETTIEISFNDGQEPIKLDLTDIENLQADAWGPNNRIPEDSTFEAEFCRTFFQKYRRKCSRFGARALIRKKNEMLEELKKSLSKPVEQSGSTEQDTSSTSET